MYNMKKLLSLAICYILIPYRVEAAVEIGDLLYNLNGDYASVAPNIKYESGNGWVCYYTNDIYIVPETVTYNGRDYIVNEISPYAFGRWSQASSPASTIILPSTVKTIASCAFSGCTNLKMVDLGGAEVIGGATFEYCRSLTSVKIPASAEYFGIKGSDPSNVFQSCSYVNEIFYLSTKAPENWVITTKTYVPDKQNYTNPKFGTKYAASSYSINTNVIEMISFGENHFVYNGQSPNPNWTNNVEGYTASLTMPVLNADVGSHEVLIPVTFTNENESFTANVVYRYTIDPVPLTVTAANASREYGEENPILQLSYSGFINGDDESALKTIPTARTSATKTSNVGEYPITVSGGKATNYTFVYEPGVLTVTKAPLSAMVNDVTKVYGSQNPAFTIDYYGLKNGETSPAWTTQPTFQTDATQSSSVGEYAIRAVNGVPINYDLGYITEGILSITPAPLTIKVYNAVRKYYSDNPTFSYNCIGFVNGEDETALNSPPVLTTLASLTSNAGEYEIKAEGASSPNYSISYTNGTLTIVPRPLTASVGNYDRPYNEENPVFEIVYTGFMGDDDEASLNEKPIVSTTATKTSDVGTYPIIVSGGSADNYNFSYVSGILTINKAEQTIIWDQDLSGLKVGDQVQLEAKATSGLPVTYTISDSNIGEIYSVGNTYYLDCKKEGQTRVGAIQAGNSNYYSSVRTYKNVVVISSQPVTGITLPQDNYTMLSIGETVQIDATVLPADATNKDVRWSSSNENVCTVANGVVTATGYGTAIVMASTIEGGYTASCTVKVLEKGDADGSGEINNHDAVAVAYYILGRPLNSFIFTLADVNEDGIISISDAVGIIDIIMKARK
jgi:hypothetical protein